MELIELRCLKDVKFTLLLHGGTIKHTRVYVWYAETWVELGDDADISYDNTFPIDRFCIEFQCDTLNTEDAQTLTTILNDHPNVSGIISFGISDAIESRKHSTYIIRDDNPITHFMIECEYGVWNHSSFGIGG
jgi:hypothetical protein